MDAFLLSWVVIVGVLFAVMTCTDMSYGWGYGPSRKQRRDAARQTNEAAAEAYRKRADEQHFWLINGFVENDEDMIKLGIYGEHQPPDLEGETDGQAQDAA